MITNNADGILRNTLIISIGSFLGTSLGFLREVVIAFLFGASCYVDAYLAAIVIPLMLFTIVNQALTTTIIPLCIEYREKEDINSVLNMLNSIISFSIILLILLTVIGQLISDHLVLLVAPGFSLEQSSMTVSLTRILLPMIFFMGLAGISTGILQSQKRFLYPAFISVPFNLAIIGTTLLLAKPLGIYALATGTLLAAIAQWLYQLPDLRKSRFRFKWNFNFTHPGFYKMWKLVVPVIIGSGAVQINLLINRMVASKLATGSIAALNYADRLSNFVYALIAVAISNAVYPEIAEAVTKQQKEKLIGTLNHSLNGLFLIVLPATIGLLILSEPLVRIAFQRGAFDTTATKLTVLAFLFLSMGLPAICLREVLLRVFYSLQDTVTPMLIGIGTVTLNIMLVIILTKSMALGGLAGTVKIFSQI